MTYRSALAIARMHLADTGLIRLERNLMVAIPQDTQTDTLEANELARAYNKLAELHGMLEAGELVTVGDRLV